MAKIVAFYEANAHLVRFDCLHFCCNTSCDSIVSIQMEIHATILLQMVSSYFSNCCIRCCMCDILNFILISILNLITYAMEINYDHVACIRFESNFILY